MKGKSGYHGDPVPPEQKYSQDFIKTEAKRIATVIFVWILTVLVEEKKEKQMKKETRGGITV